MSTIGEMGALFHGPRASGRVSTRHAKCVRHKWVQPAHAHSRKSRQDCRLGRHRLEGAARATSSGRKARVRRLGLRANGKPVKRQPAFHFIYISENVFAFKPSFDRLRATGISEVLMIPIDWNAAIKYAKLVQLAESINPTGDDVTLKATLPGLGLHVCGDVVREQTLHGLRSAPG